MGANLCLLEEDEEGELKALVEGVKDWIGHWFSKVKKWKEGDVDLKILTWLSCYGILCHAWSIPFFIFLSSKVGKFVCCDENASDFYKLDVASIMVRTSCGMMINELFNVRINKTSFRVRVMEETIYLSTILVKKYIFSSLSDSKSLATLECSSLEDCIGKEIGSEEDKVVVYRGKMHDGYFQKYLKDKSLLVLNVVSTVKSVYVVEKHCE